MRLTLAQAFNSIGATIAPLVGGAFFLTDPTNMPRRRHRQQRARAVHRYRGRAFASLVLQWHFLPSAGDPERIVRQGGRADPAATRSIWSYRHTVLGALGIFFYVGVEVGLASIATNYFKSQGMSSLKTASFLVSLYWFGALVGACSAPGS